MINKLRSNFGKRLKELRKARGLTQENLAEKTGFEPSYLSDIERGSRNITIDNIEKIAKGFGVDAYKLFFFHHNFKHNKKVDFTMEMVNDILENLPAGQRNQILQIVRLCSGLSR